MFEDPSGQAPRRDASLVFFAAIIGVPWQDLAENPSDATHLTLENADEMEKDGTWDLALPNSDSGAAPRDPLMIETTAERTGVQPIIGAPLAPDTANSPKANPINGHETALGEAPVEPQYDCIFDLTTPEQDSADCTFFSGSHRAIAKPTTEATARRNTVESPTPASVSSRYCAALDTTPSQRPSVLVT